MHIYTHMDMLFFFLKFILIKNFFIGVYLLYNVVLVSAQQQSESTVHVHIPLPSRTALRPASIPPV